MPNRDIHVPVGLASGLLFSLYLSKDQKAEDQIYEAIGGLLGAYGGSRLPDVFDPANSPAHRAFAHSATTGAAFLAGANHVAKEWVVFFREIAERLAYRRQADRLSEFDMLLSGVFEILLRITAGIGPGLIAGYMSHLALDACSRKSLPLT